MKSSTKPTGEQEYSVTEWNNMDHENTGLNVENQVPKPSTTVEKGNKLTTLIDIGAIGTNPEEYLRKIIKPEDLNDRPVIRRSPCYP